MGFRTGC
jgi:hypothetical protein